ncbi:hypothetical protein PUNSTDRAFT_47601 [Punctularia strigosozonata HHB-11173 SS5]|uniref:Uncharacterized protein n=1 Tax=Punctularia strigosozonata (strain HHB-11173) TaxID=741275 RepID=R7S1T9_PUNST|nr:uncharacterized protein PUNSTDRAFT_47601 [Punctularia strigosozonata HHB-11173 SS5]EIN04370.1 hypothetical protein PUNSTDRAFT_47601 [Punctularia strigosozonata HHB-11173 SS5]
MPALLPTETLMDIFEWASATDRHTAFNLCLVASWTKPLAERHLYATIKTEYKGDAKLLERWLAEMRKTRKAPPGAEHVRNLWIAFRYTKPDPSRAHQAPAVNGLPLEPVLFAQLRLAFPRLRSLGWDEWRRENSLFGWDQPRLTFDRIRRALSSLPTPTLTERDPGNAPYGLPPPGGKHVHLTVNEVPDLQHADEEHNAAFDEITHLRFRPGAQLEGDEVLESNFWYMLTQYHNLTHLSFGYRKYGDGELWFAERDSAPLKNLQMVVIEVDIFYRSNWDGALELVRYHRAQHKNGEQRVFTCPSLLDEDQWESEAFGGESIWERARAFTQRLRDNNWKVPREFRHW